jgi:hypothetical protein
MRNHAVALPDRREAFQVSPVFGGPLWLGDDDRDQPLVLQLRLPMSAAGLAAALYDDDHLSPADLADDENVLGFAAAAIVQDGQNAILRRVAEIEAEEAGGTLANPPWLELCRRRVAEVTGCAPVDPAASTSTITTAWAGAQPLSTTFHRPRASHKETAPPASNRPSEGLVYVRELTEIATPCRAGC